MYTVYHKDKNLGTWTWSKVPEGNNNIDKNLFVLRKKIFGCVLFHIEIHLHMKEY